MKPHMDAKDIVSGKVQANQISFSHIIMWDKGQNENFAYAISILAENGWTVVQIWGKGAFSYGLFKRE